jgi:hypothetical protein
MDCNATREARGRRQRLEAQQSSRVSSGTLHHTSHLTTRSPTLRQRLRLALPAHRRRKQVPYGASVAAAHACSCLVTANMAGQLCGESCQCRQCRGRRQQQPQLAAVPDQYIVGARLTSSCCAAYDLHPLANQRRQRRALKRCQATLRQFPHSAPVIISRLAPQAQSGQFASTSNAKTRRL